MLIKRIISILLAVIMLMGAGTMIISAEGEGETTAPEYTYNTSNAAPTMNYLNGITFAEKDKKGNVVKASTWVDSPEDKLATMDLRLEKDGYRLYVDAFSGETAVQNITTGEILFSNPYSVGTAKLKNGKDVDVNVKKQLLSQLAVTYTNITTDAQETFYSFSHAVQFDQGVSKAEEYVESAYLTSQINVKNIKNGIRVEYSIGREEARLLLPRQVKVSTFERKILEPMAEFLADAGGVTSHAYRKFCSYYLMYDAEQATSEKAREEMYNKYPITKKMAVYILDANQPANVRSQIEGFIKERVPDYTYEDLDEDHLEAEYEAKDDNPPLFKMALEYTLDEYGLSVRLPANGIRFNESLYRLDSVEILPYMGAGTNTNSGYTFYPDGSGTLFDFEELNAIGTSTTLRGKVYGQDFAYHTLESYAMKDISYPVFGVVEDETLITDIPVKDKDDENAEGETDGEGTEGEGAEGEATEPTPPAEDTADKEDSEGEAGAEGEEDTEGEGGEEADKNEKVEYPAKVEYEKITKKRGYIAIVEEGDALMELVTFGASSRYPYNNVKMVVYPRPQDTYNIEGALSVGSNTSWTVVSDRKYTGSYKLRYVMLTSDEVAEEVGLESGDYYKCDYVGMALAYRDYLDREGVLTRLTSEDVSDDIPMYIETFGAIDTIKRILSIPVNSTVSLTSFENIKTMYDELSSEGVKNINFILTGYTKGGMYNPAYPSDLRWERAVGGSEGFEDLLNYAKEKEFGVYPDFDFVFISSNTLFDGVTLKKHAIKTIDDRYTSKRVYSATKQTYMSYFELAMSPAYYNVFYEKLTDKYLEYDPIGISVSTLGTYLNSDFDEDEPYNREDSKAYTIDTFEYLDENYASVMTSGGNAYSWKFVDHITDVALDSSRLAQSAAAVPFVGIVLHGYVQFAGTPSNMEGNMNYALLKAIENGASINFILSYQNTNLLKESATLSQYYSVRYDIWYSDVVDIYNELNALLKDLQTSVIVNHTFIDGERVPDADEILADAKAELEAAIKLQDELAAAETEEARLKLLESTKLVQKNAEEIEKGKASTNPQLVAVQTQSEIIKGLVDTINTALAAIDTAKANSETLTAEIEELEEALAPFNSDLKTLKNELKNLMNDLVRRKKDLGIDVVEDELEALKAEIKPLNEKLETLNGELAKLNDELTTLNGELTTLNGELAELNANAAEQAEIDAKQAEIDAKQAEIDAKQAEIDAKQAEIDAKQAEIDAKQPAVDAKQAEVDTRLLEVATELAAVNAKQAEVDAKQAEVDAKQAEIDAKETLYDEAQALIKTKEADIETAKKNIPGALSTLYMRTNNTITEADKVDALYAALVEALDYVKENQAFPEVSAETILAELQAIVDDATVVYEETMKLADDARAYASEIYELVKDIVEVEEFTEPEKPEEEPEEEPEEKEVVSKYVSDKKKIALVEYENGTSFILNFNDYEVITVVDGVTYTIGAYGYVVLKN